jgi:hypothetical protein
MSGIYLAGSGALTVMQLGSQAMVARRNRWGWPLRIVSNLAAIPYNIVTGQFFFVAAALAGIYVAARAFRAWGAAHQTHHGRAPSIVECAHGVQKTTRQMPLLR